MKFRTIVCAGSALAAFALPAAAAVQPVATEPGPTAPTEDAATAPAAAPNPLDIIVTARRRAESVQSVPLAISVVDARTLESTGSFNVAKLTQLQPSLQFYSTNPRNSAANIRGLGAPFGLTNDGIEQGVGVYIDQVYNSRIAAATFDFLDVEQVEVLRGPQGTLYGKNTTAGAINITTRAPSFEYEGRAEATVGNLGFVQAKASVSGPLIADRLAIRLAASTTDRNGTIYNVTSGRRVNEQDNLGFRGSLLWRASEVFKLTLSGDYNRQNPECCAQIYVRTGATQRPLNRQFAGLAAAFGYAPPSTNAFDRRTDLDTPLDAFQEIGGASLRAEWEVGPGTLTSVSAWRFWNWAPSNDRDFTGLPITTRSNNPSKQDQYSQELRYAVSGDLLDYVVGLFAYHQKQRTTGVQEQGIAASRWLLNPTSANANNPAVLNGLTSSNNILFTSTSLAAFGQVSWKVTDRLKLQPGLRVNYDRKSGNYVATVTNGAGVALDCTVIPTTNTVLRDQCATLPPQSYNPRFSDWNVSGDFTASYQFDRDVLAYATYARSFKSGGINLAGLPLDAGNRPILGAQTVRPESVNHYELGLKTQLFDRRATFNLAAFWTEIGDYQATVTNGQLGVLRGYLANADKVRVRGIEADVSARPTDRLTVYASGAFTDHEYVKFVDAPCPPELSGGTAPTAGQTPSLPGTAGGISPSNCDISGQWLPGISKWAFSYGVEYNHPVMLFGLDGQAYAAFDGNYRSKFSSNPSRSAYTDIAGYAVANVRAGFRATERWDVFGWVRNAFDRDYFDILATQSGSTGLIVGQPADPRTYGLTVKRRF
ncbi:TonB-dependent receptor [Sphingomonas montana]|uniref:TonB-dependent receptor n=1 Tax=Sphingomonas montana TaxID=1843236 RepID=UPI00096DED34|nr:TonB-dependent receptor [Sphingomonas montana]